MDPITIAVESNRLRLLRNDDSSFIGIGFIGARLIKFLYI